MLSLALKDGWLGERSLLIVNGEMYLQETRRRKISIGNRKTYVKAFGEHEHRVVAEIVLGRRLGKDEVVHHKNDNKSDNRPQNLEVMLRAEHSRSHSTKNRTCSVAGCNGKHNSRGLCNKHYHDYRRTKG